LASLCSTIFISKPNLVKLTFVPFSLSKRVNHTPLRKTASLRTRGAKAANVYKHTKLDMRKPSHSNGHRCHPGHTGFVGVGAEVLTRCEFIEGLQGLRIGLQD